MKAMVLAAGLGTRLRPLTHDRPKALVEVAGRTMLELTLTRLRNFGINDVIINVHHYADLVIDYLQSNKNFGMNLTISREDDLLDTGGGLKKASAFFLDDPQPLPFLLHNVDILSSFDLAAMLAHHNKTRALATLAVQQRHTSRPLLFDKQMQLRGRQPVTGPVPDGFAPLAFAGIHILSPPLLHNITEEGAFSIITTYLRLAAAGEPIRAYRDDTAWWCDLGKPESVAQAARDLSEHPGLLSPS